MSKEIHRYRVIFDFDVTIDSTVIEVAENNEEIKEYDRTLLSQFLAVSKEKLRETLLYYVATELAWMIENDFEKWIIGEIDSSQWTHRIFGPAIDSLNGKVGAYWREVRDMASQFETYSLSDALETIFACIEAKLTKVSVEDKDIQ